MVQARNLSVTNPYITPPNSDSFRNPNLNIVISSLTTPRDMSPCSMNFILRKDEHNSFKTELYSSQTRLSFPKQQLFQTIVIQLFQYPIAFFFHVFICECSSYMRPFQSCCRQKLLIIWRLFIDSDAFSIHILHCQCIHKQTAWHKY